MDIENTQILQRIPVGLGKSSGPAFGLPISNIPDTYPLNTGACERLQSRKRTKKNIDFNEDDFLESLNNLYINKNQSILSTLFNKIEKLEKKFDNIDKLSIKIDNLEKNIEKMTIEKDYIIDNLKEEIKELRIEINYNSSSDKNSHKINDYFY